MPNPVDPRMLGLIGSGFNMGGPPRKAQPNPAAALAGLDANNDPSAQLLQLQRKRREELAANLAKRDQNFATGGTPQDLHQLDADIQDNPIEEDAQQAHAFEGLQRQSNLEGFGSPQEANAASRNAATLKTSMPLLVEQEKNRGEGLRYDRMMGFLQGQGAKGQSPAQPGGAPPQGAGNSVVNVNPNAPGNSVMDLGRAFGQRTLSSMFATEQTPLIQNISLGNLEAMPGLLPGVRGFSTMLPLFREHQASFGHETPQASYVRLHTLEKMLEGTNQELSDITGRVSFGPDGSPRLVAEPQMIQRGRESILDTLNKVRAAKQMLQQQTPGIERSIIPTPLGAGGGRGGGPAGSAKRYLDDQGNPIRQ